MSYLEEVEAAHAARVARLRSDRGWLSLVGKTFLSPGVVRIGSAPECEVQLPTEAPAHVGTLRVGDDVRIDVEPSVAVTWNETRVTSQVMKTDRDGPADRLIVGPFALEIMERGESRALRVRDTRGQHEAFAGIERFPVDPAFRVTGTFNPHPTPLPIEMDFEGATDGRASQAYASLGTVTFVLDGKERRLEVFDEDNARLFILFRDATSGSESYPVGRFVYAPLPGEERTVVLDFNRAMLPGCAFSLFATCPVPPPQNRLDIAVRAGERHYLGTPLGSSV